MIGWIDASSGASGDMLLGALVGAGVPVGVIADAVEKVAPEHVAFAPETVSRNGLAATRCHVEVADSTSVAIAATATKPCISSGVTAAPPTAVAAGVTQIATAATAAFTVAISRGRSHMAEDTSSGNRAYHMRYWLGAVPSVPLKTSTLIATIAPSTSPAASHSRSARRC